MDGEIRASLETLDDWVALRATIPWFRDHEFIESLVQYGLVHGIESAFLGRIEAAELSAVPPNYRETYLARGLNSRQCALLELMVEEIGPDTGARIYAPEAVTALAAALRARYPRFHGSEFGAADEVRRQFDPIPTEDLCGLSFPNASFDVVITSDVLEHVSDLRSALSELARVLRPGGVALSTFPFNWQAASWEKAKIVDGQIAYLMPPEYHGNPADPGRGTLVFTIPGWDIIPVCREVGFRKAEMVVWASASRGIVGGGDRSMINVLRAYR
jgi:SAM-dependent methyltransferase